MTAFILPSIWSQFKFNLLLQIFDGLFTYHVLTQGVPEANPLLSSAIAEWGAVWGIVYWKLFACALLAMIFALRHLRQALAMKQRCPLGSGIMCRDSFERIPDHDVGIRKFFHWKVTFEHAAINAEFFNAEFAVRS